MISMSLCSKRSSCLRSSLAPLDTSEDPTATVVVKETTASCVVQVRPGPGKDVLT